VGTLVACGGTYPGLGEDLHEAGGPPGDDSGGLDAIFPVDDGATFDTTDDTRVFDSTLVDSGASDANDAADSTLGDANESGSDATDAADSTLLDALDASDSGVDAADTAIDDGADSTVVDTGTPDTGTPDTGTLDTGTPDTGPLDTGTPDTGPLDTGTPDTGVVDMGTDAGLFSTNPNRVYCGNTAGLLCAKNESCCGSWSGGNWSYACGSSCGSGLGSRTFACNEKADCASGQTCCGSHVPFSAPYDGSTCRSGCYLGETPLCMTDADCSGGKHCAAATTDGASNQTIGACN
jgi:hypothetical protein